ncbi:NAD(P)-dependent oxidoreductase [Rhodosalinus sp. FB01]|uniref:NAD(P)-dependent oxidoreductase n=1 Tax=Rhodosalinus sp. FB01 TaxID=3239194 RepID=UPI00352475E8
MTETPDTANPPDRIGIVGLGKMGRPVGRHLRAAGYSVTGFDPSPEAAALAREAGIDTLECTAALAAVSDLVLVLVGFDDEVEASVFGPCGVIEGAHPGTTVAIGSTISPSYARSLASRLADGGMIPLDVPSARGEKAVEEGTILLLGAGDKDTFDRWRPAFETFCADILHLGDFGAGQIAKLANNMILWASMAANDEALRLAEALGADKEAVRDALSISSARNWALTTRAEEKPIPWAEKDIRLALSEADDLQFPLHVAAAAGEAMKAFKARHQIPTPKPTRGKCR